MSDSAKPEYPHKAAHFGLASLFLGGIPLIVAPQAFTITMIVFSSGNFRGMHPEDRHWTCVCGYLAVAMIAVLALVGLWFGMRGFRHARATQEPTVLCRAGAFVSLVALLLCLGIGFVWHLQAWRYLRFHE